MLSAGYLIHCVLPFGLAMIITFMLIPLWINICTRWKLFDEPDIRKHHLQVTPSMGGIALFAGVFISFLVFADIIDHQKLRFLFGAGIIIFFTGFFDDLMNVTPVKKLLMQVAGAVVVCLGGFKIISLEGFLWINSIPVFLQLPLSIMLIVLFTNAYNFIDGVDGLAGSLGLIISTSFVVLFFNYGKPDYAVLSFCITGALLGFLFFNFSPAKIFMGDTGSLTIGFILATLSIELLNSGINQPEVAVNPSILLALLFIPLYDVTRVFLLRMGNGKSPFHADRNHIHHLILGFGFGHRSVSVYLSALTILLITVSILLRNVPLYITTLLFPMIIYIGIHPKVLGVIASIHHRIFGNHLDDKAPTRFK